MKPGDLVESTRFDPLGLSQLPGPVQSDNPVVTYMDREKLGLVIAVATTHNYTHGQSVEEALVLYDNRLGWGVASWMKVHNDS